MTIQSLFMRLEHIDDLQRGMIVETPDKVTYLIIKNNHEQNKVILARRMDVPTKDYELTTYDKSGVKIKGDDSIDLITRHLLSSRILKSTHPQYAGIDRLYRGYE
ncbi:MAG: hypothetical protein Q7S74_01930 [Nanoarchaeota archaeon]|nr:hypothetical protein [Nanoarchaeota archaeon]